MQIPTQMISAIVNGDDDSLNRQLDECADLGSLLAATIRDSQPTNHAIGYDMTLLQFASFRRWKSGSPAQLLIERGAEVDLHSACGLGLIRVIEEKLPAERRSFDQPIDTYFPLQFAITGSQPSAIECLLQQGDNVNRGVRKVAYFGWEDEVLGQTYSPWLPIHMATLWGFDESRVPVLEALATGGVDLEAASPLDGFTALHLASMAGRTPVIRWLVDRGVDVNIRSGKVACFALPEDCAGATSGKDLTPIMVAAAEGFPDAVQCLVELGSDTSATNDEGLRAIDFAKRRHWSGQPYDRIIEILSNR